MEDDRQPLRESLGSLQGRKPVPRDGSRISQRRDRGGLVLKDGDAAAVLAQVFEADLNLRPRGDEREAF